MWLQSNFIKIRILRTLRTVDTLRTKKYIFLPFYREADSKQRAILKFSPSLGITTDKITNMLYSISL